jgi:predicted XRE-type DNA-binding protein
VPSFSDSTKGAKCATMAVTQSIPSIAQHTLKQSQAASKLGVTVKITPSNALISKNLTN